MKPSAILSVALLSLTVLVSCNLFSDLNSTSLLSFKVTGIASQKDSVLFSGKDIKSFNDSTGEVTFNDTLTIRKIRKFHKFKCYLGSDSIFAFGYAADYMSSVVNDLVFYDNILNKRYYFADGYPNWIDNLGTNSIRLQNKQKRAAAWAKFIAEMKLEGKSNR